MKHKDDPYIESLYYISILYPMILHIVEFAAYSPTHPILKKLSKYYLQFKAYLHEVTSNNEMLSRYMTIIDELPLSLDTEDLLEWNTTSSLSTNNYIQELHQLTQKYDVASFTPSKSFQEAIKHVETYLQLSPSPNEARLQDENKELIDMLININKQQQGKIIIYSDGWVEFYSPKKVYRGEFGVKTNNFKLLEAFSHYTPNTIVSYEELALKLNPVRQHAIDNDVVRRVTDTISYIRKIMEVNEDDDMFISSNGYGVKYSVEVESNRH